jgi:flagellar secretion chaperone FliS
MPANPYQQAEWAAVDSADPVELVVLLYEKALSSISQARECVERKDIAGRSRSIQSAVNCIVELVQSLDMHGQPEMAGRLLELYVYALDRLREANFQQSAGPLTEAESVLSTLAQAWRECQAKLRQETKLTSVGSLSEALAG